MWFYVRHRSDATSHSRVEYTRAKGKVTRGEYSQALVKWNIRSWTELTSTPEQYVLLACTTRVYHSRVRYHSRVAAHEKAGLIVYLAIMYVATVPTCYIK